MMAVAPQRGTGGTLAFVMVFFFKMWSWARKGGGGKTHSGIGTVLEPCWIHSGTVLEPPTILLEPAFRDGLALCVFAHFACLGPRPTGSYIILRGNSTYENIAQCPGWQRPGRHEATKAKRTPKRFQRFARRGSRILPHVVL